MTIDVASLPDAPSLARVRRQDGVGALALWRHGMLHDLSAAPDAQLRSLDLLLTLSRDEIETRLADPALAALPALDLQRVQLQAPAESQEVWGAGVTYRPSREARMEEALARDVYASVYQAERPEIFFKSAGWRVVPDGGEVGVRSDSSWDVPEPELAVLSNSRGEVVAYTCGNDMSSRSIEGENPLYLPQAKVYDASCALGPVAVLARYLDPRSATISMTIERAGEEIFHGAAAVSDLVRDPAELVAVLHAVYTLPAGAWLLTGTSIVPPSSYTARAGDIIEITIEGLGALHNRVRVIPHSGARAPARAD